MKTKTVIIAVLSVLVISLLAWAPWVTDDYAKNKVIEKVGFPNPVVGLEDDESLCVTWIPFGRFAATYEHGWFVTFFGAVI